MKKHYIMLAFMLSYATVQASNHVTRLTQGTFDVYIQSAEVPVVVDFFAQWCGPCKAMAPRIEKLAAKYKGQYLFVSVDIDTDKTLADRYDIRSMPTFIIFNKGKKIGMIVGKQTEHDLIQKIKKLL